MVPDGGAPLRRRSPATAANPHLQLQTSYSNSVMSSLFFTFFHACMTLSAAAAGSRSRSFKDSFRRKSPTLIKTQIESFW
jgi:hypothetical protein